ncbi:oxidoreductase, partial [Neisseria meningitidis]
MGNPEPVRVTPKNRATPPPDPPPPALSCLPRPRISPAGDSLPPDSPATLEAAV